ncbi:MAG: hypothetical protein KDK41_07190 [Leptospiraceae bacterium]|nr:hypothetical protein [Leptospiraceae bacterium]
MEFSGLRNSENAQKVNVLERHTKIPECPVVLYVEGDGCGPEMWQTTRQVLDAVVKAVYNENRKIEWLEVLAGEKAAVQYNPEITLPADTLQAIENHKLVIKGPTSARTLEYIKASLELTLSLRILRGNFGIAGNILHPERINTCLFELNEGQGYHMFEAEAETEFAQTLASVIKEQNNYHNEIMFPFGFSLQAVSQEFVNNAVRSVMQYTVENNKKSVVLVHRGNLRDSTEGQFVRWANDIVRIEYANQTIFWEECGGNPPAGKILIRELSLEKLCSEIIYKPAEFEVIAGLLPGMRVLTESIAAQIGMQGHLPAIHMNPENGISVFDCEHGTFPKYAGLDKVNPFSQIYAGILLFEHIGWKEAAALLDSAVKKTIAMKTVTYDLAKNLEGAREVKCSEFGQLIIQNLGEYVS